MGQEWRLGGLKEGANSGLYQLKVMDGTTPAYLAMELNRGTGDYELRVYSASEAKNNLEATLWCVSVSNYNQGQAPIYDFQNKLSGTMLDLTMAGHEKTENGTNGAWKPVLGGEIAGLGILSLIQGFGRKETFVFLFLNGLNCWFESGSYYRSC